MEFDVTLVGMRKSKVTKVNNEETDFSPGWWNSDHYCGWNLVYNWKIRKFAKLPKTNLADLCFCCWHSNKICSGIKGPI